MDFTAYKAIIRRNKFVRITIIYDLLCCFMLMAALFGLDSDRNFFSVMFAYAVPLMCAAILGMYAVSMSSNRKICLLFPSLTYHLSLLIYTLLANDIPALVVTVISFVPFLLFAIHIFTGKFDRICMLSCSSFVFLLTIVAIAAAVIFLFASLHNTNPLAADLYALLENNLSTVEVCSFTACALVPFIASYISVTQAVIFEEKRANGENDRPPESILI